MRISLCLVAAFVAALHAIPQIKTVKEDIGNSLKLPDGLPDGAIVTIYLWHQGEDGFWSRPEDAVEIGFFDELEIKNWEKHNMSAHFRIVQDWDYPVYHNTYMNGKWTTEGWRNQPLDVLWTAGWWRLDVIKHDEFRMNVFFQGFWSDSRFFDRSLKGIRSVYVFNQYLDENQVQIHVKLPNHLLPQLSLTEVYSFMQDTGMADRKLTSFSSFPIGEHIKMIAVLRASGGAKYNTPSLVFESVFGEPTFFLKILQIWKAAGGFDVNYGQRETQWLYMTSSDGWNGEWPKGTQCTVWEMRPNGDLSHLSLERVNRNELKLRIFYKTVQSISAAGHVVECTHKVPDDLAKLMDMPFDIISHDGAFIYHLEHSIPRTPRKAELEDNRVPIRALRKYQLFNASDPYF